MDNANTDLERQLAELRARREDQADFASGSVSPSSDLVQTPILIDDFDQCTPIRWIEAETEEDSMCRLCRKCRGCDSGKETFTSDPKHVGRAPNAQMFLP